jgi:hypothetical protein
MLPFNAITEKISDLLRITKHESNGLYIKELCWNLFSVVGYIRPYIHIYTHARTHAHTHTHTHTHTYISLRHYFVFTVLTGYLIAIILTSLSHYPYSCMFVAPTWYRSVFLRNEVDQSDSGSLSTLLQAQQI